MRQKSIVIRADANSSIGMGHIMRTLSIADAFKSTGNSVRFILADDTARKLVNGRGYEAIVLDSRYNHMDDELSLWPSVAPDLIIADSYYVTSTYLSKLRYKMRGTGKLAYLDDVLSFPYPVDILVNYNAYASQELYDTLYVGSEVDKPKMVLGPTYAPLRSMFRGVERKIQPEVVRNILISTGGSDELHLSLSLLKKIVSGSDSSVRWVNNKDGYKNSEEYIYHFLIGAMNADKEAIHRLISEVDNVVLHENVTDMRVLIDKILREIIGNILMHRDFSSGHVARMVIEKDQIEIVNANRPHGHGNLDLHRFSPFQKNPAISQVFRDAGAEWLLTGNDRNRGSPRNSG